MTSEDRAAAFAALHKAGDPLLLYNVWDAGSARIVAEAGARAIATGSFSVAAAWGYPDGEALPLESALANAERIVGAVDRPVTVDFERGYGDTPEQMAAAVARLAATKAIGCNVEDGTAQAGLRPVADQAERLRAARAAAGAAFFINARTDIFLKNPAAAHDAAMVDAALERAGAYAQAGASGFFVPGLADLDLLARLCAASPLPVNFMAFPGGPTAAEVAGVGIARISHGPFPYRLAMKALKEAAERVYGA